ncbi:malate dehydrogenase, partial [bacterium]|nr:malate dehydrogenase [bacterium]
AMTYTALKVSGFPKHRVAGMAGILDSSRLRHFIAEELKVSAQAVEAMVLGGHGDEMVPCLPLTRMAGVPVAKLLSSEKLEKIITRTRHGGGEIVKLLRSGSAYYAPAASAAGMVAAVLRDEKAVMPCAAWLMGEYGHKDVFLGVPVILGRRGVERIVEIELEQKDEQALRRSAEAVRELCHQIDGWL